MKYQLKVNVFDIRDKEIKYKFKTLNDLNVLHLYSWTPDKINPYDKGIRTYLFKENELLKIVTVMLSLELKFEIPEKGIKN